MNAHDEQILNFARRLALLEQELEASRTLSSEASSNANFWALLADDLADQLRAVARGEEVEIVDDDRYSKLPLMRWKRKRQEAYGVFRYKEPVERFEVWP